MTKYVIFQGFGLLEIEQHKKTKKYLNYIANHDALTQLPNRHYLITQLHTLLDNARINNSYLSVRYYLARLIIAPYPDIEITMVAQVLNTPKKFSKSLITNGCIRFL